MNSQFWFTQAYQVIILYGVIIVPGRIQTTWKLMLFHFICTSVELGVLSLTTNNDTPYYSTITNAFLILATVSYYRVLQRYTGVARNAFDIEARLWRRFGRSDDEILQQSLSRRLRLQQHQLRQARWDKIRITTSEEERAAKLAADDAKYSRLADRIEVALKACQNLSLSEEERGETEVSVLMEKLDINKRAGKDMMRWLAAEIIESEGFIKPVKWSKDKRTGAIVCHNGYTDKNIPTDFFANPDDLIIGSISVTEPSQIEPALSLIETALDHIRFYDINNFPGHEGHRLHPSHTQFRRAVAVSCEMKRYAPEFIKGEVGILDVDDPNWNNARGGGKFGYVEKDCELVSLLTVSVDRYLTVTFHIAYMLQHCDENLNTCDGLQLLFQGFILNSRVIKIWKDTPRSIAALDATLEHIFRGSDTPENRQAYLASLRKPFRDDGPTGILRHPGYKDTGPSESLNRNRPTDTEFRHEEGALCPLNLHGLGVDYAGRTCPCDKGIIDISALLDFILQQHRFVGTDQTAPHDLKSWEAPHSHSNLKFSDLARWLLAGHKWQPFMSWLRESGRSEPRKPNTEGLQPRHAQEFMNIYNMRYNMHKVDQDKLFTTGEETKDIERDDICLSYVLGKAIGLGLILRTLLTCESPILTAERLSHYAYKTPYKVPPCAYDTALFRKPVEPVLLPPLEVLNSFALGLEANIPKGTLPISAWERLASSPAWFLKQSTHGRAGEEKTYSSVIGAAFILAGWEHPIPPAQIRDSRAPPPRRFGMTTPAKMETKLREATVISLAEVDRENRVTNTHVFELMEKAFETNFTAEVANAFALRLERGIDYLGGSRSNKPTPTEEIHQENVEKGRGIDRLTRQTRLVARAARESARLVYDLKVTTTNLLALIVNGSIVPLPSTGVEAMTRIAADEAISLMALEAADTVNEAEKAAETAHARAAELQATSKALFSNVVLEDASDELDRAKEKYAANLQSATNTRSLLRDAGIVADGHAKSGKEIPAGSSGPPNSDLKRADSAERQKLAQNVANAATDLRDTMIIESTSMRNVYEEINEAISLLEELDTLEDDEQSAKDGSRRRKPGEQARVKDRLLVLREIVNRYKTKCFTSKYLARVRKGSEKARNASELSRSNLEVAKAREAAEGLIDVRRAREALRIAAIDVPFRQAQMDVSPSEDAAKNLNTAQKALQTATNSYEDAVGAVHINRGTEMAALRGYRAALETAYLDCADNAFNVLQGTYYKTTYAIARDFETPEEMAVITAIDEMFLLAVDLEIAVKELKSTVEKVSIQSAKSVIVTKRAGQTILQREAFAVRLPTLRASEPIVDGNFGLALSARNLIARVFRVSNEMIPEEYATTLQTGNNLTNVTWFEMFSDLFGWHCGLGSQGSQGVPPNHPAVSTNEKEIAVRQGFISKVVAEIPNPEQVSPRKRQKSDLHDFVNHTCAEILIFMLVREISRFEKLDAARRLVLGIDRVVSDYNTVVGYTLWDSIIIERAKREFQLDNFLYQDSHWFKRLQVLLGYEFPQGISIRSPSSKVTQECGAKDISDLVEMLILEVERFLKIYKYQESLADNLRRTVMNPRRFSIRRLGANTISNAIMQVKTFRCDRRSPLYLFEKNIVSPDYISDAAALEDARTQLDSWRVPEWLGFLLLKRPKIDCTGVIERLFTPQPNYYLPDPTMSHAAWMRAVLSLLITDPEIELDSWDGLCKWWRNGLYIQALGLADEHVEQALLPDLRAIRGDSTEGVGPVPEKIVQSRRVKNARSRASVDQAESADREIDRLSRFTY